MALDKLVDSSQLDADLTSVANAIRTKGGTSAQLAFPQGFVDAVEAIETGGGDTLDAMIRRQLTEYENTKITTHIRWYQFSGCTSLESVSLPNCTKLEQRVFDGCTNLAHVSFPKVTNLNYQNIFLNCSKMTVVAFPALNSNIGQSAFQGCTLLSIADFASPGTILNYAFNNATNLKTMIIRKTSVPNLNNINAFNGTPFASGGDGGTLYVPQALISSYQSATNWSTILGYANNKILPIEGSIYETQYGDGTPIA